MIDFDPGYVAEPYISLCKDYESAAYPGDAFRLEWGPIFHRGRLDGSARVFVIGQDPAAQEDIARRILVGTAGHRVQGFLAKLGITRSYVMLNTFAFSVLNQTGGEHNKTNAAIIAYRNRWFDAVLGNGHMQAVVAFGDLAHDAWQRFLHASGQAYAHLPFQAVRHPTWPESSTAATHGGPAAVAAATATMLTQWNAAITALRQAGITTDAAPQAAAYGSAFTPAELPPIPAADLPAGLPSWMTGSDGWASRTGANPAEKRKTLTVVVPG